MIRRPHPPSGDPVGVATPPGSPRSERTLARLVPRSIGVLVVLATLVVTACIPTGPGNERISVGPEGQQFDRASFSSDISADGRFVAFASGVESFDPRGSNQIFRKDRANNRVELVSQTNEGEQFKGRNTGVSISADGTKVAFQRVTRDQANINDISVVFVRDLVTQETILVSATPTGAEGDGTSPHISSDGRFVAFTSTSSLVAADTNGRRDVYVRDLVQGTTRRASVTNIGGQINNDSSDSPSISGDGRFVTFGTALNLTPADTDSDRDVYVRDMVANTTTLASLGGAGTEARTIVDISDDGRFVVFLSPFGANQAQAWVRDRATGQVRLISHTAGGPQMSNNVALNVDVSRDGAHVAFASLATDLVPGDTNGRFDVFVAPTTGGASIMVSKAESGALANGDSIGGAVANGGTTVAFQSKATNLVAGDTNGVEDIFVNRQG